VQFADFGRSGLQVPRVWLRLLAKPGGEDGWAESLAEAATATGAPIDVSAHPALWGSLLPATGHLALSRGGRTLSRTRDSGHASEQIQAHLFETLCSLRRERLDLYLLSIAEPLEEFQIAGALDALQQAKQEGHLSHIGLDSHAAAPTLAAWRFHDVFDAVLVPRNHHDSAAFRALAPLARERNVGLVTSQPFDWGWGAPFFALKSTWRLRNLTLSKYGLSVAQAVLADLAQEAPVLVGVRTSGEVAEAVGALDKRQPDGLEALMEVYRSAFLDEEEWRAAESSEDLVLREAALRRRATLGAPQ